MLPLDQVDHYANDKSARSFSLGASAKKGRGERESESNSASRRSTCLH